MEQVDPVPRVGHLTFSGSASGASHLRSSDFVRLCFPRQVCIPVVSVRLVKKHKTAGLVPNGLAITMDTGQKVSPLTCPSIM